mmetsp:Transcript_1990/g.3904  ORF Transcript_1990/g.3904 Transcript_1990/m.3904 type:complete len:338 (-) Transcript_1990:110-1123(-)
MSHAATFDLSDELGALFSKEVSGDGELACIQVCIVDERFTLGATIPLGASAEADFEATKRLLSEDAATYLLFRQLRGGESQCWAFISFVPDTAPVKQKMLYANAKDTLKKRLPGGDVFGRESHFSDLQDFALSTDVPSDQDASMKHIMTEAERMVMHEDLSSASEAAAGKVKSAGLNFPLEAAAAAKVGEFRLGAAHLVVLEIIEEQIILKGSGTAAAASDVQDALPAREPSYCLFRWGDDAKVLFIFCCPDDAPVRGKMLHASSKASMLEGLQQAFGVGVDKSLEISDAADVTEDWLKAEVYGAAPSASGAAVTLTAKARAPGGSRKLTRKQAPPA